MRPAARRAILDLIGFLLSYEGTYTNILNMRETAVRTVGRDRYTQRGHARKT